MTGLPGGGPGSWQDAMVGSTTPIIERLLRIIDEGRRTATYKLAVLMALMDVVVTTPGITEVRTRVLAERVTEIYFNQVRPYVDGDGVERELRQINMSASALLRAVDDLRRVADRQGFRTLGQVRTGSSDEFDRAVDVVEETLVRYPIPLLEVVGGRRLAFLYDIDWVEGASLGTLRRNDCDCLRLREGVAEELLRLSPLLRPLIELHWQHDVARWSGVAIEDRRLREHLFGAQRSTMPASLRTGLVELQDGRCFYCEEPLPRRVEVDHFVAWSRWPNNAIENLVAADRCNGAKSDHLAAHVHARRWMIRNRTKFSDLNDVAARSRWDSDLARSEGLGLATYAAISLGTPLWLAGKDFVDEGPVDLATSEPS